MNTNRRLIRKISAGSDYPHNSMHFEKGQTIKDRRKDIVLFTITDIVDRGDKVFEIWATNSKNEVMLWDKFVNMPVVVQYEMYL